MEDLRVSGFSWSGVRAGIKSKAGKKDLGLILAERPVPAAAVFTKNVVRAAPVELASERLRGGRCQAVLVNSGNANACTGAVGRRDAKGTTRALARALGIEERWVIPASTGVIGVPLPAEKIHAALPALLRTGEDRAADFSKAILTTDRGSKVAATTFRLGRESVRVACIAKGAGMIAPHMATTLAFLATDATVPAPVLRKILRSAVGKTFNRMSVDGDTSTNDMILAMASGDAHGQRVRSDSGEARKLGRAVEDLLLTVGKMILADGEGSQHVVHYRVSGAPSDRAALQVAKTVAGSLLVKTALFGADPNWGRIVAAAGRAGVPFRVERATVAFEDAVVYRRGQVKGGSVEKRAHAVMSRAEYSVHLDLGAGPGKADFWGCDLSYGYVRVNAEYRT
ncbi:MAG: bifunctional glutamate N-acetyltransferase/amino-acid acetyltransferase ArgJ [Myxococcales bacterium]|nr:bifunctional glutamate N-acetyltransferase/amino-acid acetyltransferase ArgJ [Myxococcales bacterium]